MLSRVVTRFFCDILMGQAAVYNKLYQLIIYFNFMDTCSFFIYSTYKRCLENRSNVYFKIRAENTRTCIEEKYKIEVNTRMKMSFNVFNLKFYLLPL